MKEKIYTIPVNEAFDSDCECAFCYLAKKADNDILDYVLGPSYMEEDIREETNKIGFCRYHYDKMFHAQNRLGVALMVSTHLKDLNSRLDKALSDEISSGGKPGIFSKPSTKSPLRDFVDNISSSCYACQKTELRMDRYFYTFIYLWKTETEFREKVKNSKGFCLEHLSRIVTEAKKRLSGSKFDELMDVLSKLQKENFARINEELDWFIRKFDYRFQNEPWKNSKDSLERSILKISSAVMED